MSAEKAGLEGARATKLVKPGASVKRPDIPRMGQRADQNEKDHAALDRAVRTGKVQAVFEEEQ